MEFTALRYFSETADSHSIRAASERLHVSPSAISRQIAKIEHELDVPVFDRRADGMVLTPAGEILKSRVEGLIREFARVRSHIAALHSLQAGTVDVYCYQTAIESLVSPVLHALHRQHPNILFNVRISSTDEAIEALTCGVAEVGLIVNPPARETITSSEIFRDALVAALATDHPLAKRKILSLQELAETQFILTERSFGLRQQIDHVFNRHAFSPKISCVTNSLSLAKAVVSLGELCTLLPRFALEDDVNRAVLVAVPVEEYARDALAFCVCVRAGRTLSPAAKVFVDAVIQFCERFR